MSSNPLDNHEPGEIHQIADEVDKARLEEAIWDALRHGGDTENGEAGDVIYNIRHGDGVKMDNLTELSQLVSANRYDECEIGRLLKEFYQHQIDTVICE